MPPDSGDHCSSCRETGSAVVGVCTKTISVWFSLSYLELLSCVCVCVAERDREKGKERGREGERGMEREGRERCGEKERERGELVVCEHVDLNIECRCIPCGWCMHALCSILSSQSYLTIRTNRDILDECINSLPK